MEWRAEAILLSRRSHGESSAIIEVLSQQHGRFAGLVRGASSKRLRGVLQPGNRVLVSWRARLSEHLGMFSVEDAASSIAHLLDDRLALAGLSASCALISASLPEREVHARVFDALNVLVSCLDQPDVWPALYIQLEAGVLSELGYGLSLDKCVATGQTQQLGHVSPRSGGAVCKSAAEPYMDKLLPLPGFMSNGENALQAGDVKNGLALTGYFLERRLFWPVDKTLPQARERMIEQLVKAELY